MNKERLFVSTIDSDGYKTARKYELGLEIAQYCTAWNMDRKFETTDSEVKKQLQGIHRRILHAPFNELFPCAIDPKARELASFRYRQAMNLAMAYHAKKVVIHGGYYPKLYYPSWYAEQSFLFWRDFAEYIPSDLTICLENVFEEEPEMLMEIVERLGHPQIKLCLDIGHVNAYSGVSAEKWLTVCGKQMSHFHIHNNASSEDTHNALYDGTIRMPDFLRSAEIICPEATYTLEVMNTEQSVLWLKKENLLR